MIFICRIAHKMNCFFLVGHYERKKELKKKMHFTFYI